MKDDQDGVLTKRAMWVEKLGEGWFTRVNQVHNVFLFHSGLRIGAASLRSEDETKLSMSLNILGAAKLKSVCHMDYSQGLEILILR